MPAYLKRVDNTNPIFKNRVTTITSGEHTTNIPIPNNITLCNGCNQNTEQGYFLYVDKEHLDKNIPYDYYCDECAEKYLKDAVRIEQ